MWWICWLFVLVWGSFGVLDGYFCCWVWVLCDCFLNLGRCVWWWCCRVVWSVCLWRFWYLFWWFWVLLGFWDVYCYWWWVRWIWFGGIGYWDCWLDWLIVVVGCVLFVWLFCCIWWIWEGLEWSKSFLLLDVVDLLVCDEYWIVWWLV